MRIRQEQLSGQLQNSLAPIYLVSGDETLLVQESCDQIKQAAKQQGFNERELLSVESNFNWDYLVECSHSLSLFGDKKLIELRILKGTPDESGKKALALYAQAPAEDNVLLIVTPKLSATTLKTKWFKQVEAKSIFLPIWPMDGKQLPQWIRRRMQHHQLQPTPQAVQILTERVEGNLLAAAQEIDKLLLLYGAGPIDDNKVLEAVNDNARFDIYQLVDTALSGNIAKTQKIISELQHEGIEPGAALWACTKEIRSLAEMSFQLKKGKNIQQVLQTFRVWDKRKPVIQSALRRKSLADFQGLLQQARHVDLCIKGMEKASPWQALSRLLLDLSR